MDFFYIESHIQVLKLRKVAFASSAVLVLVSLASLATLTSPPPGLHVVWVGRREPAVGLGRLRLQGRVHDVGACGLALRPDEVARVLARSGHLRVDEVTDDLVA